MVVYQCAECEANISRSVVSLVDQSLLRTDPDDHVFSNQTGNPDMVPQGFQVAGPTEDFPTPGSTDGWPILNPEDMLETEYDWAVETGCCGPPGESLNTGCRNGHKVAAERRDCYTVHAVALDPDRIIAVESPQPETHGLDDANPAIWFETLERGSISDQRRAIALFGAYEYNDAVPVLHEFLEGGPVSLRKAAARSLGRIGTHEAVDTLVSVIADDDPSVRRVVVMAIGACDVENTDQILLNRLVDESVEEVCWKIKYGVGRITADEFNNYIDRITAACAQKTLVELLPDEGAEVAKVLYQTIVRPDLPTVARKRATVQLGYLGKYFNQSSSTDGTVATYLVTAIDEVGDSDVRVSCIHALHNRYINQDTVPTEVQKKLQQVQDDPNNDEAVRSAAENAL